MLNNINIYEYNRSVKLYKITDGEYIDNYVSVYLEICKFLRSLESASNSSYKNSENDLIIEYSEFHNYYYLNYFKLTPFVEELLSIYNFKYTNNFDIFIPCLKDTLYIENENIMYLPF